MLDRLFKKEKPKLYLGALAVAPRSDIKRHLDQWSILGREDLDSSLRQSLEMIFELPLASEAINPRDVDLALDVVVPKFQSGDIWEVSFGEMGFLIAWRPKIKIAARLYRINSKKTIYTVTVEAKMPLKKYFSRLFTLRTLFRFKPMFDSSDMSMLLHKACMDLLHKLGNAV